MALGQAVSTVLSSFPNTARGRFLGQIRQCLGEVLRRLAERKESLIWERHLMPDHVHMMISIPSKYSVSQVIGYIKGKGAIPIARVRGSQEELCWSTFLGARLFMTTVGRDEAVIREYIRHQEQEDLRQVNRPGIAEAPIP